MTLDPPPEFAPRRAPRVPIQVKVNLEFEKFAGSLAEASANLSEGGMFIKSPDPKPVGTILSFEFRLDDDATLLQGLAEIVWVRKEDQGPERPRGMAIRFHEINERGRDLIRAVVNQHLKAGDARTQSGPPTPAIPSFESAFRPEGAVTLEDEAESFLSDVRSGPSFQPTLAGGDPEPIPVLPEVSPEDRNGDSHETGIVADTEGSSPHTGSADFAGVEPTYVPQPVRTWSRYTKRLFYGAILLLILVAVWQFFTSRSGDLMKSVVEPSPLLPSQPVSRPAAPATSAISQPETVTEKREIQTKTAAQAPEKALPSENPRVAKEAVPLTAVTKISWKSAPRETVVMLTGDGTFKMQSIHRLRLGGGAPRELVRIVGVSKPYPRTSLSVRSPHLKQIRVGLHESASGSELHIVLDLASSKVRLAKVEPSGTRLLLHLQ
ncbi:MAG: PilZ domain-containing protein [Pseudomonadota bacterium]